MDRRRVIILCTGNSCRSQMAEAFWRIHGGDAWDVVSAGTHPAGYVHPLAIRAMAERGIDIRGYQSKSADLVADQPFDLVITVCDHARQTCPVFPHADEVIHHSFVDPVGIAGTEEQRMEVARRVRDDIESFVVDCIRTI